MAKKDLGVLYIRYDKNTFCGQIIEKRKEGSSRRLNGEILKLIFLSEIVEPINFLNVDLGILNDAYYQSLKLFSDKLDQTYYKLKKLNEERIRQKNREADSPLSEKVDLSDDLAFLPAEKILSKK